MGSLFLCLFAGLRKNEAAALKWSDIDLKAKIFTVRETKNDEDPPSPFRTSFMPSSRSKNRERIPSLASIEDVRGAFGWSRKGRSRR